MKLNEIETLEDSLKLNNTIGIIKSPMVYPCRWTFQATASEGRKYPPFLVELYEV